MTVTLQYMMTYNEDIWPLWENDKMIIFIAILVFDITETLLLNAMLDSALWMSITLQTAAN